MTELAAIRHYRIPLILIFACCYSEADAQNEVIGRAAFSGMSLRDISDYALKAAKTYEIDTAGVLDSFKFAGRSTPDSESLEQELFPRERGKLFVTTEQPFRFREVDYQQLLPGETMKVLLEADARQIEAKEYHVRWDPLPNEMFRVTTTAYGEQLAIVGYDVEKRRVKMFEMASMAREANGAVWTAPVADLSAIKLPPLANPTNNEPRLRLELFPAAYSDEVREQFAAAVLQQAAPGLQERDTATTAVTRHLRTIATEFLQLAIRETTQLSGDFAVAKNEPAVTLQAHAQYNENGKLATFLQRLARPTHLQSLRSLPDSSFVHVNLHIPESGGGNSPAPRATLPVTEFLITHLLNTGYLEAVGCITGSGEEKEDRVYMVAVSLSDAEAVAARIRPVLASLSEWAGIPIAAQCLVQDDCLFVGLGRVDPGSRLQEWADTRTPQTNRITAAPLASVDIRMQDVAQAVELLLTPSDRNTGNTWKSGAVILSQARSHNPEKIDNRLQLSVRCSSGTLAVTGRAGQGFAMQAAAWLAETKNQRNSRFKQRFQNQGELR